MDVDGDPAVGSHRDCHRLDLGVQLTPLTRPIGANCLATVDTARRRPIGWSAGRLVAEGCQIERKGVRSSNRACVFPTTYAELVAVTGGDPADVA